ncbi:Vga family ABC-F type ribosomal protection protein [Jeotgalibacillus soli]|uniref:ABC transporter n=1 Tax=Jeotgalibacillus soli TaxID=889306 RepID=A0A0C2VSP9_9BACL|nr:ABC-F type ribosomal protection protein [Jeotgalibacillus soli]KIL51952.1 ABC transporter [Jeotgalibacillus soli]
MMILEVNKIEKIVKERKLFEVEQLRIHSRDRIGLVGRNGSGKTTLLNLLAGKIKAEKGTVETSANRYLLPQLKEINTVKSGGEVTQQYINQALASKADILFADEPTTNLDMEHVEKLEVQLTKYQGAIVIVSHDRSFLDQLCTKMWEIEDGKLTEYKGNYTRYLEQKQLIRQQHEEKYEQYVKKKEQLERAKESKEQKAQKMVKAPKNISASEYRQATAPFYAGKQKKMHQGVKAIETRINKLEHIEKPKDHPAIKMDLPNEKEIKGRNVLRVNELSMKISGRVLWEKAKFLIKSGEKAAIIGKNGAGKTTLLKQLLARPDEVLVSSAAKIGYFSQNLDILDVKKSILENVKASAIYPEDLIRTVLARLHFYREDVFKKLEVLSGGERVKVAIAKVFLSDINVLVMDEPTNFLDIEAVEALESLLTQYKGTVIFVSHDRRFIENVSTKVIEIKDQMVRVYEGDYRSFKEYKEKPARDESADEKLMLETKLTEVISRLSIEPTEELEKEFQDLLKLKK